jgi:hypothetical protein
VYSFIGNALQLERNGSPLNGVDMHCRFTIGIKRVRFKPILTAPLLGSSEVLKFSLRKCFAQFSTSVPNLHALIPTCNNIVSNVFSTILSEKGIC